MLSVIIILVIIVCILIRGVGKNKDNYNASIMEKTMPAFVYGVT